MGVSSGRDQVNKERRRLRRYSVRFQVTSINGTPCVDTFIFDISPLGLRMETPATISPLDTVEMKFLVPGEARETRIAGEVVWLEKKPEVLGIFIIGIAFLKPQWGFIRFDHR